jgi:uncharacterized protein YndB with AHSA1/START domain
MRKMTDTTHSKNMVLTRVFDAPVEKAWQAWGDVDYVRQWWGPMGFTCPVAEMDFREGGMSLVCMRAPQEYGGQDMYNTWTYTKIVPLERIEFYQLFSDANGKRIDPTSIGLPPEIPLEVPHIITFKSLGANQTEITVTEFGYSTDEIVEMSKMGMAQCLDKMAASLK